MLAGSDGNSNFRPWSHFATLSYQAGRREGGGMVVNGHCFWRKALGDKNVYPRFAKQRAARNREGNGFFVVSGQHLGGDGD